MDEQNNSTTSLQINETSTSSILTDILITQLPFTSWDISATTDTFDSQTSESILQTHGIISDADTTSVIATAGVDVIARFPPPILLDSPWLGGSYVAALFALICIGTIGNILIIGESSNKTYIILIISIFKNSFSVNRFCYLFVFFNLPFFRVRKINYMYI